MPADSTLSKSSATENATPKLRWDLEPMRIAAMQVQSPEKDSLPILDKWHEGHFNVEQLLHVHGDGYYAMYDKKRHEKRLTQYISLAHDKGMKIIGYINVMGAPSVYDGPMDDWYQWVCPAGSSQPVVSKGPICVNSPWREVAYEAMRGMMQCGADGVFMDGPHISPNGCYCGTCRTLFKQQYGIELPTSDKDKDAWAKFQNFRRQSITNFVRDARSTVKAVKPDGVIYLNHFVFNPTAADGQCTEDLLPLMDWIGSEGGFLFYGYPQKAWLWKTGSTARMLESIAPDKPRVIFIDGANCPWNHLLHTPAETQLMLASTIANGANYWYCFVIGLEDFDGPGAIAAMQFNKRLSQLDDYFRQTTSAAEVALLWSQISADFDPTTAPESDINVIDDGKQRKVPGSPIPLVNEPGVTYEGLPSPSREPYHSFQAAYGMLWRSQVPFDIMHDQFFTPEQLSRYKVLILPNTPCMNERTVQAIRQWVRDGGKLIAFFESSLLTEKGGLRKDFQLADVFGVEFQGGIKDFHHYARFDLPLDQPFAKGLFRSVNPAPRYGLVCKATTATPVAHFYDEHPRYYMALPKLDMPAIYHNRFGSGECYYFNNKFCENFNHYGFGEYRTVMQNLLAMLNEPLLTVESPAQALEAVVREQSHASRRIIHLTNFTGSHLRPIEQIVPLTDTKVTLRSDAKPKSVQAIFGDTQVQWEYSAGYVRITLPRMELYEAIAVQW